MDLSGLSSVLWREREILETLLYRLEIQQMLLMSGRTQWLVRASGEVEAVLETVGRAELQRAVEFDRVAQELGLEPNPSLSELAAASAEPWQEMLNDHYRAFMDVATRIQTVTSSNREMAAAAQSAADSVIAGIHGSGDSNLGLYAASGESETGTRSATFLDEGL